jgi:hypothetical protein
MIPIVRSASVVSAVLWAGVGCAQVLGIEQAQVEEDPASQTSHGTEAGASDGAALDAEPTLCERYCALVMDNCGAAFPQYESVENCLGVCRRLPLGEPGSELGNSVHCRLRNAELAPAEPPTYCSVAGPSGGGVCGTPCESFCTLMQQACPSGFYQDGVACATSCESLPDLGSFTTDPAHDNYEGGHVQCRLYHVTAAILDPSFHCPHAFGEAPCVEGVE